MPSAEDRPAPAPERRRAPRPRFYVSLLVVTLGTTAFAIAFRAALDGAIRLLYGADDVIGGLRAVPVPLRWLVPAAGAALAGAASAIASRRTQGRGVGEVMEAVVVGGRKVSLGATSLRALGSWLAIGTGGSIGREGPLIQFGAAMASAVGTRLDVSDRRQRALIGAGTAAGFSAAYNTPLAAVLFVVEVITGVQALGVVLPVMIAAAIASAATRAVVGPGPLYGEHAFGLASPWELLLHLALGAVAGLAALAFMRLLRLSEEAFARLRWPRAVRAALGGAIVGGILCLMPEVAGNGYEPIRDLLTSQVGLAFVAGFIVLKPLATSASVGSGSPGGVFTPSMALGAALGLAVGRVLVEVLPADTMGPAGGYALVGMAAVVAATTQAPLMAAVLVFELTGDYAIVLPLLIASSTAAAVARHYQPLSIYMQELRDSGVAWEVTLEGRRIVKS